MNKINSINKALFGDKWLISIKNKEQDEKDKILRRANFVLNNYIIFNHFFDMEQCNVPYEISIDNIYNSPNNDDEWIYMLSRYGFVIDLGIAYRLTNDKKYFSKLKEYIFKIKYIFLEKQNNEKLWRPIDIGIRLTNIIWSLIIVSTEKFDNEELKILEEIMEQHIDSINTSYIEKYKLSNWGVLALAGVALFDMLFPNKIKSPQSKCLWEQLNQSLELQFLNDGVHWEVSPLYQHQVIVNYCYIILVSNSLNLRTHINYSKSLKRAVVASYYLANNQDILTPLHDSDFVDFSYVYDLYRGMGFLPGKYTGKSILYYGTYKLKNYSGNKMPNVFIGEESGLVVIKDGDLYFTQFNGRHGSSHGHASNGSITLSYKDKEIISDGGRYTYRECKDRRILKGFESHNTFFNEFNPSTSIIGSWKYGRLTEPIAQKIKIKNYGYMLESSWKSSIKNQIVEVYKRKTYLLDKENLCIFIDKYHGNGEQILTTINFNENCKLIKYSKENCELMNEDQKITVWSSHKNLDYIEGRRSNIYNQLTKHTRIISRKKVMNNVSYNITVLSYDGTINVDRLKIYRGNYIENEGAIGIKIETKFNIIELYTRLDEVVEGSKLMKSETGEYFYNDSVVVK